MWWLLLVLTIHIDNKAARASCSCIPCKLSTLYYQTDQRNATFSILLHWHAYSWWKPLRLRLFQLTWDILWKCALSPSSLEHFALHWQQGCNLQLNLKRVIDSHDYLWNLILTILPWESEEVVFKRHQNCRLPIANSAFPKPSSSHQFLV